MLHRRWIVQLYVLGLYADALTMRHMWEIKIDVLFRVDIEILLRIPDVRRRPLAEISHKQDGTSSNRLEPSADDSTAQQYHGIGLEKAER